MMWVKDIAFVRTGWLRSAIKLLFSLRWVAFKLSSSGLTGNLLKK